MIENRITTDKAKVNLKNTTGLSSVLKNPNMPNGVKNMFLTNLFLKPSPITGSHPRG